MKHDNSAVLGIEFGSTRIKAVILDCDHNIISSASYSWQAKLKSGIWTYDMSDAWVGLNTILKKMSFLDQVCAMGISGMMHGYLAFDKDWNLLSDFRTWQNTITEQASTILSKLFQVNIPQRWSVAHLYQAILNCEEHIKDIAHITTLSGYIHYMLTGENVVGIGEASGMFPVDYDALNYDREFLSLFDALMSEKNLALSIESLLPKVLTAGDNAGYLTAAGSSRIGDLLSVGIPFVPPEGDAGTGMVATNSVIPLSGNVSAGTSIFSMVVLNKPLANSYREIDMVATPSGQPVAMVHCNNCSQDLNDWVKLLKEVLTLFGFDAMDEDVFSKLFMSSLVAEPDCGGLIVYNYTAGEEITKLNAGCPMVLRPQNAKLTISNFIRAHLFSAFATLKLGLEILEREGVRINSLVGHGGLFKTPGISQRYLAAACNSPVTCMSMAGEGGPFGMALLVAYGQWHNEGEDLSNYLNTKVFKSVSASTIYPDPSDVEGFSRYLEAFKSYINVEHAAEKILTR